MVQVPACRFDALAGAAAPSFTPNVGTTYPATVKAELPLVPAASLEFSRPLYVIVIGVVAVAGEYPYT